MKQDIIFKENIQWDNINHMNLRGYAEDGSLANGDKLRLHGQIQGELSDGTNVFKIELVRTKTVGMSHFQKEEVVEAFLYTSHTEYVQDCATLVTEVFVPKLF
jgi:hypothetical protein